MNSKIKEKLEEMAKNPELNHIEELIDKFQKKEISQEDFEKEVSKISKDKTFSSDALWLILLLVLLFSK